MLSRGYLNYSNNSNITELTRVTLLKSNLRKKIVQERYHNEISVTFSQNESKINTEFLRTGPFIIATNLLDSNELTHDSKKFVAKIKRPALRNSVLILLSFWENLADISLGYLS